MKRVLLAIALVCAVAAPSFAQSVVVAGTKVLDNAGAPLVSGQWCLGTSCLTVTNGAFSGSVTAATANITVINGATTYLTIPSVTIAGSYFSWDTYVVPSNASISGIGTPRIACTPGAIYTQTDGAQNQWQCKTLNGAGVWSGLPNPGTPWTVTVGSVNTLASGAPATVTNSGNANAAILNFGIPQGAQGIQGIPSLLGHGQGAWAAGTTYSQGDVVTYGGNSYASFSNSNLGHEPDTSPTFWGMLANLNNLPTAFATQSAANPDAGTFTTVAAGGTLPANHVIIGALGTPTLWNFDTTSPATALSSLNGFSLSTGGTLTTNGTYTGSAYNSNAQFLYDGATGAAAMTETQGHAAGFSALTAGSNIPSSSTTYQAQGLFGFLNNSSPNTNGVGVYGVCYAQANNGKCWGMNPLAVGAAGYTNQVIYGIEDDVNIEDATDTGFGLNIIGAWTAQPTGTFPAIDLGKPLGGTGTGYHWNNGIQFESGCCGTNALYIEPIPNTGGSIESQHVAFVNTNHPNPLSIYENAGDGFQIDFNDGSSIVFPEIHTTRIANIALSNHPQMFINTVLSQNTNIATGSCTFSAGSCAFNYGFTYGSVPYCEATPHYDGLAVGSTPPTIWIYSKTTTTVTIASSSNTVSGSAEVTCFGN